MEYQLKRVTYLNATNDCLSELVLLKSDLSNDQTQGKAKVSIHRTSALPTKINSVVQ